MKVTVNHEVCEGHGKCVASAPEVFVLGDDELARVIVDEVPEELKAKVDKAIRLCPRQAINWEN